MAKIQDQIPDYEWDAPQPLQTSEERKGRELTDEEEKEWRDGQSLYEMKTTNPGWQVVKDWLEQMAYHSWIDPRTIDKPGGLSKEEWEWRELNAFYAANQAKELLVRIDELINKSDYLGKVRSGEVSVKGFKI